MAQKALIQSLNSSKRWIGILRILELLVLPCFHSRFAGLLLHRTLEKVKSSGINNKKESFYYLKKLILNQNGKQGCKKLKSCQICRHSRILAEKSPAKEMLVPVSLGNHSHRFKGAVYGIISLKSTKRFKDQPLVKALDKALPCLQVHIHPFISNRTVSKSRLYQTNGPFLRSFTFSSVS